MMSVKDKYFLRINYHGRNHIANNQLGLADVGTSTNPSFTDIDKDGDLDTFLGNGDVKNPTRYLINSSGNHTIQICLTENS